MLVSAVLLSWCVAGSAAAQTAVETNRTLDTLFGSHAPYQHFFGKLQEAVSISDKRTVASMVDYPFLARIDGKAMKVKQAIVRQTYSTLFVNWQGVSIGDGEVWFSGVGNGHTIKITAIND
jgi:hypothetical protein